MGFEFAAWLGSEHETTSSPSRNTINAFGSINLEVTVALALSEALADEVLEIAIEDEGDALAVIDDEGDDELDGVTECEADELELRLPEAVEEAEADPDGRGEPNAVLSSRIHPQITSRRELGCAIDI